jgi:hypothetical protein
MKSHSIAWSNLESRNTENSIDPIGRLSKALWLVAKTFVAVVPALAILTGAAWLITAPELTVYLQAVLWTAGFVFLGLAIDSERGWVSIASLVMAVTLPTLALLSSSIAVELAMIAAALVAVWVAVVIFRQ